MSLWICIILFAAALRTGAVVCIPADLIPVDKKNWYVPAWLI